MTRSLLLRSLALTFLALPLLTGASGKGCGGEDSSSVKQDRVVTQYSVHYDANTDVTFARATFRFGNNLGTVLELTDPASVTFNGKPLAFQPVPGWHELQLPGKVVGTFVYQNVDGASFTNEVTALPEVQHPATMAIDPTRAAPPLISAGQSFSYAWQGPPVVKDELVQVTVSNENRFDFSVVDQRGVGATDLVIPADKTRRFAGAGWLVVKRTLESAPKEHPGAGGFIWATTQPKDAKVTWTSSAP